MLSGAYRVSRERPRVLRWRPTAQGVPCNTPDARRKPDDDGATAPRAFRPPAEINDRPRPGSRRVPARPRKRMKKIRSLRFVARRTRATAAAQADLADRWLWEEKSVAEWNAAHARFDELLIHECNARAALRNATAAWDLALDRLQAITRDVVHLGRVRFRREPVKRALFAALATDATSRDARFNQAAALRDAWDKAESTWVPLPDVTLPALRAWLEECDALKAAFGGADTAWQQVVAEQRAHAEALDADCVAWYAAATRRFPQGTPERETIRSVVPTTYRPGKTPGRAALSVLSAQAGQGRFRLSAPRAARFTVWHQLPGEAAWRVLLAETRQRVLTLHLVVPGTHRFKAAGRNAHGTGPESEVLEVTVPATAAG
jgi:hypothetical protein